MPLGGPHSTILQAWNDGVFSDVTVTCGTDVYQLHKLFLCQGSDFFSAALRFPGKEQSESHVIIQDEDPDMFRRMLMFIYFDDYDPTCYWIADRLSNTLKGSAPSSFDSTIHDRFFFTQIRDSDSLKGNGNCACISPFIVDSTSQSIVKPSWWMPVNNFTTLGETHVRRPKGLQVTNSLVIHASMYALADKYGVHKLVLEAQMKFGDTLRDHWASEDFVDAVAIAYRSTPDTNRGLRDEVVKAFKTYLDFDVADVPGIEEKLHEFDNLTFTVLKQWSKRGQKAKLETGFKVQGCD